MFIQPLKVIVVRHRKERVSKCSLRHIHNKEGILFLSYPPQAAWNFQACLKLDFEGPVLSFEDRFSSLILVDATWRYAYKMCEQPYIRCLPSRSLDASWQTAYVRRQEDCSQPNRGLASIEALYAASLHLGCEDLSLLNEYYWRESFLKLNHDLIETLRAGRKNVRADG